MTAIDDPGCCVRDEGHDGPCEWICSDCDGLGTCPECGGDGGLDDVQRCEDCDGTGRCLAGCYEGRQVQE